MRKLIVMLTPLGLLIAATLQVWALAASPAQAASFDCAKAGTKVEHLICDDPEISKLDEELNSAYKTALQDKQQADTVKQAQKLWMKERNECTDNDCLEMTYRSRLDELRPDTSQGRFVTILAKDKPLCDAYKRYVERETALHERYDFPVMCHRPFGKDYPEFKPVKWREIDPKDRPELSGQAAMYIDYWPWKRQVENWEFQGRTDIVKPLSDAWFKEGAKRMEINHTYGGVQMWLGEADIGNTGQVETLLRVKHGRCEDLSSYPRPPWGLPVMVLDPTTTKIDTVKSEWILGVTVLPQISRIQGLHLDSEETFDVFGFFGKTYFDRWEVEWAYDRKGEFSEESHMPNFAALTVYFNAHEKTTAVCRYKFKK